MTSDFHSWRANLGGGLFREREFKSKEKREQCRRVQHDMRGVRRNPPPRWQKRMCLAEHLCIPSLALRCRAEQIGNPPSKQFSCKVGPLSESFVSGIIWRCGRSRGIGYAENRRIPRPLSRHCDLRIEPPGGLYRPAGLLPWDVLTSATTHPATNRRAALLPGYDWLPKTP
jgi:hypothetical protein